MALMLAVSIRPMLFHPPGTSDVPTLTVTIAHPNLSGHLTFDEQYKDTVRSTIT
jgi:hypothetical protein